MGVFDKDGKKDRLGSLSLLTSAVVQVASKEVKDGHSIYLNWHLDGIKVPGYHRKSVEHKVLDWTESSYLATHWATKSPSNTRCSSQWDSLIHYAQQTTGFIHNGVKASESTLTQGSGPGVSAQSLPTLDHWHGRGVMVDKAYAAAHGIDCSPFENHNITVETLEAVLKQQGTILQQADILLVRTGLADKLTGKTGDEHAKSLGSICSIGVEGSVDTAWWFWNHHFAAVAGDTTAFENLSLAEDRGVGAGGITHLLLHQYFISLFGLHIGEFWELKALGEHCARSKRSAFLPPVRP